MQEDLRIYLEPTPILDSCDPELAILAQEVTCKAFDPTDKAVRLYYWVRDNIWYDPYVPFYKPEHYRASRVLKLKRGYCVSKASLLCAMGRACGIPSRLGFADVRNHLATRQLIEWMGTDLFVYHGFTEFHLEGKWVKATPAFNKELCEKHRVEPLEFDGRHDSIFQPYNSEQKRFMEYVAFHGSFQDVPVQRIVRAWEEAYGKQRVQGWIRLMEMAEGSLPRDFYTEEVIKT
ncbi:MAG: transglutaminase-like domain-containing protein [bacterium]